MRLKEIKPGMVVHCKTLDEMKQLIEFCNIDIIPSMIWNYKSLGQGVDEKTDCLRFDENGNYYGNGRRVFYENENYTITEFSDLILPELKAEEVVPILTEICNRYNGNEYCEGCPLNGLEHICNGNECPFTFKDYKQVMEICVQWKTNHEKKEPEIETVDICRIIEIQPDGRKRCVHEEYMGNIPIEEGKVRPSDRNIQKRCREILKRYCMEHEGEFIAVHEVVSRVKAVE